MNVAHFAGINTRPLADVTEGSSILVSFADIVRGPYLWHDVLKPRLEAGAYTDVILDSGAFTVISRGITIDIDAYAAFASENQHLFTQVINLDDIAGDCATSRANLARLADAGVDAVPVFHQDEDWAELADMCASHTRIGVGFARKEGGRLAHTTKQNRAWLTEFFEHLPAGIDVHGFAMTRWAMVEGFPFTTTDSTTWISEANALCHRTPYTRYQGPHGVGGALAVMLETFDRRACQALTVQGYKGGEPGNWPALADMVERDAKGQAKTALRRLVHATTTPTTPPHQSLEEGRPMKIQANEMIIDLFAGAGGASVGIERATGRPADVAINHDRRAIEMHESNHPNTRHYESDVFEVDPRDATGGRPVGLLWMSPDCKHFSRAKGQTPVRESVRALADVIHKWIEHAPPRIIILENVQEFEDWGPLIETANGLRPDPERTGEDFKAWLAKIVAAGYTVEFQAMNAADYGAATTRVRFFLVARRDRGAVVFPEATHSNTDGDGLESWIPIHRMINWGHENRSIFGRKRPLAAPTMNRIAMGIERYVSNGEPFIVRTGHYSKKTGAGIVPGAGAGLFRGQPLDQPVATLCATNDKNLVVPWLIKHYGGRYGNPITDTLGTITARDSQSLASAVLAPADAVDKSRQVAAFLVKYFGTAVGQSMRSPVGTLTTKDRYALVEVHGQAYRIVDIRMRMLQPDELYRAQGFGTDYNHTDGLYGKPFTKTEQIRFCGNSVCPDAAQALVAGQLLAA